MCGGGVRIYVDFDCCLFEFGNLPGVGRPIPGAVEAMQTLAKQGHYIVIYSTRANRTINRPETRKKLMDIMESALDRHRIPYDEIADDKPAWDVLIDDRCIRFQPNQQDMWTGILTQIGLLDPLDWSVADGKVDHTYNNAKVSE
jgi:hypothetical protein